MKFVYMRTTCSVSILNMVLTLELNLLKQLVFILLCLFLICAEYELETFGATSDEIRLMAIYLIPDFIDVSLKTYVSSIDEIGIITKVLYWKWATNMPYSNWRKSCHNASSCDEEGMEKSQSDENSVLAIDILLISSDYRPKRNLLIILKFGNLHATYSLSVQYLSSKHDSRYVMGLDI